MINVPEKFKQSLSLMINDMRVASELEAKPISLMKELFPENIFFTSVPKECFQNCFIFLISNGHPEDTSLKFSLGFYLKDDIGIPLEHAVIKLGDSYADPTLNGQGGLFVPVYELTYAQLIEASTKDVPQGDIQVPDLYQISRLIKRGLIKDPNGKK